MSEINHETVIEQSPKKITLWEFWNSKIGLALFASVVTAIVMNFFTEVWENSKTRVEEKKRETELLDEITFRIHLIDAHLKAIEVISKREKEQEEFSNLFKVFSGDSLSLTEAGQGIGMIGLYAEYVKLNKRVLNVDEEILETLTDINFHLGRLTDANLNSPRSTLVLAKGKYHRFRKHIAYIHTQNKEKVAVNLKRKLWGLIVVIIGVITYLLYRLKHRIRPPGAVEF